MNKTKSNKSSNLIDHLTELRSRLLNSFIFFIVVFFVSYFFSEEIYRFLVKPYSDSIIENNLDRKLIFTALHEAFLTYLKVAFFFCVVFENETSYTLQVLAVFDFYYRT